MPCVVLVSVSRSLAVEYRTRYCSKDELGELRYYGGVLRKHWEGKKYP
jgi:hypothetical protein